VNLSEDMKRVVLEQRLGFVATVTPDGRPNLSPKGTTTVWDDEHLVFADIASPGTVANLAVNPHVEVNVVDPIVRKGYRFKGTATVHTDGHSYERGMEVLRELGSTIGRDRVRSIVVIEVTSAAPIFSPAYDDPATTEHDLAERWLRHHTDLHQDSTASSATAARQQSS
jgi:predicted pyridoxine 5'-phosphate oxidase superfamily flavin-nucleotide-binding protein